jgi:hypothetical protein
MAAKREWNPIDLPDWLSETFYHEKVQPLLTTLAVPSISLALSISEPYATDIRNGKRLPHQRHWLTLVRMVGVSKDA